MARAANDTQAILADTYLGSTPIPAVNERFAFDASTCTFSECRIDQVRVERYNSAWRYTAYVVGSLDLAEVSEVTFKHTWLPRLPELQIEEVRPRAAVTCTPPLTL